MPVFESKRGSWLSSVAFSPVNPTLVASGGIVGMELFDVRQYSVRYLKMIQTLTYKLQSTRSTDFVFEQRFI